MGVAAGMAGGMKPKLIMSTCHTIYGHLEHFWGSPESRFGKVIVGVEDDDEIMAGITFS